MLVCMGDYLREILETEFGAQVVVCCLWLSSLRIGVGFSIVLGGCEGKVM